MALALQLKTNKKIKSSKMAQPEKPKKQKLIEDEYIGELVLQFKIEDLNKTSARTAKWKEVTTLFNEKFCQNLERKQISKRWTNLNDGFRYVIQPMTSRTFSKQIWLSQGWFQVCQSTYDK